MKKLLNIQNLIIVLLLGLFAQNVYLQEKINTILEVAIRAEYYASEANDNAYQASIYASDASDYASDASDYAAEASWYSQDASINSFGNSCNYCP